MLRENEIIGWSSLLFWIILSIILLFLLPFFKAGFFDTKRAQAWLDHVKAQEEAEKDSTETSRDSAAVALESIYITWSWEDYEGSHHEIAFHVDRADSLKATEYRKTYNQNGLAQLYYDFVSISAGPLDSMAQTMILDIQEKGLTGRQVYEYVVTAIQTPTYTKVASKSECPCFDMGRQWEDDCKPRSDGKGCCNSVTPRGVFSPTEFIVQKTGDCDTKALTAYALLKRIGFRSALIVGDTQGGSHAMLALADVTPVIPTRAIRHRGRVYHPWEVTSFRPDFRLGSMNMWRVWRNWEVVCD